MKSYLSLIPISAKMRKKQNRMTILCIVLAVFLITTVFSTADALLQAEKLNLQTKHGNWQYAIHHLSEETAIAIQQRNDVDNTGWHASYNVDAEQNWTLGKSKAALYGTDSSYLTNLTESVEEGTAPEEDTEVMLSSNAREILFVQIGDTITLHTPAGDQEYTIIGFGTDEKDTYQNQTYLIAMYMTRNAFDQILNQNNTKTDEEAFYIQFAQTEKAKKAITELEKAYQIPEENVSENTAVMAFYGSSRQSVRALYPVIAVLFLLVLMAGSMMISGSMNSSVAQRTQFFGMMRCIGASKRQIRHFVQMEALNWCRTAIPAGLLLGTVSRWGICAMLHYGVKGEFANLPVWGISLSGILSGTAIGLVTVLLSSRTPAKRASRVSPVAAVAGNTEAKEVRGHGIHNKGHIEYVLGIHHATASKKNWLLMTASFSLIIVLLFSFSVGLDFFQALIPDMKGWTPDVILNGYANELNLSEDLKTYIGDLEGVKQVYGTGYLEQMPATCEEKNMEHVNLISYSDDLLDYCAGNVLTNGTMDGIKGKAEDGCIKAVTVSGKDNPLRVGDHIQINGKEVAIVGMLSSGIWEADGSVICSDETFTELTGQSGYSNLMIQLNKDVPDQTIKSIQDAIGSDIIYSDMRESNHQDRTTYQAFQFVVYGFLVMIALITLCHMMNSISISVISHTRQYGAMRAVGMDQKQIRKMIGAESFTYVISGLLTGCTAGILLHRVIYERMITHYFGTSWSFPAEMLLAVLLFGVAAGLLAVYAPAKRTTEMPVTRTIQEL